MVVTMWIEQGEKDGTWGKCSFNREQAFSTSSMGRVTTQQSELARVAGVWAVCLEESVFGCISC